MAYAERERTSLEKMETQITDLEARALEALEKDHEDLALEASEAIANLEAEASATRNTVSRYASEIARLRICLKDSEAQLIDLKRGLRLAEANERAIKLRGALPDMATTDLEDAAETLKRLQARQEQATATADAMVQLSTKTHAGSLEDRLASAGCGAPRQSDAATVLARLKAALGTRKDVSE